jgi:glycerol-3-phosphate cytidylyltransferase-like family protein
VKDIHQHILHQGHTFVLRRAQTASPSLFVVAVLWTASEKLSSVHGVEKPRFRHCVQL